MKKTKSKESKKKLPPINREKLLALILKVQFRSEKSVEALSKMEYALAFMGYGDASNGIGNVRYDIQETTQNMSFLQDVLAGKRSL